MSDFDVKQSLEKAIGLMKNELEKLEDDAEAENLDTKSVWSLTTITKTLLAIHKQQKDYPEDVEDDFSHLTAEELDALARQTAEDMKKEIKK
jgi:hypothetical protein